MQKRKKRNKAKKTTRTGRTGHPRGPRGFGNCTCRGCVHGVAAGSRCVHCKCCLVHGGDCPRSLNRARRSERRAYRKRLAAERAAAQSAATTSSDDAGKGEQRPDGDDGPRRV